MELKVSVLGIEKPVHLRLRTSDVPLLSRILLRGEYDWEFARAPLVIVDAGANIGLTSIFYANKYPHARIFAIEPESSNFRMLEKNASYYSNIVPLHAALWNENVEITVTDPGSGQWGFQTTCEPSQASSARHERVLGITVDRVMELYGLDHIDVLKLDIEGAELQVFQGASAWIDRVRAIAVELHESLRSGCGAAMKAAARDFEYEWRNGEITYLAREDYAGAPKRTDRVFSRRTPPLVKILQVKTADPESIRLQTSFFQPERRSPHHD